MESSEIRELGRLGELWEKTKNEAEKRVRMMYIEKRYNRSNYKAEVEAARRELKTIVADDDNSADRIIAWANNLKDAEQRLQECEEVIKMLESFIFWGTDK